MAHSYNTQDALFGITRPSNPILVCDGDSLSANQWITQIQSDLPGWDFADLAAGGRQVDQMAAAYQTATFLQHALSRRHNVSVLWGGTNDITVGTSIPNIQADITSFATNATATGFTLIVLTIIPNIGHDDRDPDRQELNDWIRANSFGASAIADPCALEPFDSNTKLGDTTYYTDGAHLTEVGSLLIKNLILSTMVSLNLV